jgi:aminopeptidase-like protein
MAMLWTLGYSDGETSLLRIAQQSGLPFADVHRAAMSLAGSGLLEAVADEVDSR